MRVIGFQLGLFDSSVINAILVVILASVLASTIVGARASARLPSHDHGPQPLGTRVVVGVDDPARAGQALSIGVRMARADGGVVHPVLVLPDTAPIAPRALRERFGQVVAAAGAEGLPATIVDRSVLHGALRAAAAHEATLVLVSDQTEADRCDEEPAADASTGAPHAPPIAVVRGDETLWVDAPADSCYSR
jgi:hypothetical protein